MWKVTGIIIRLQVAIKPKIRKIKGINHKSEQEIRKNNP